MNLFLLNPQSKRAGALKGRIKKYLADLNVPGEFIEVKKVEDLAAIVKKAVEENAEKIVAIGGDGMINRIVPLIAKTETSLGVVPIGETNFFANIIGIKNWKEGCKNLVQGKISEINLGMVNERYFISSVEIDPSEKEKESKRFLWFKIKKDEDPILASINIKSENSSLKFNAECYSIMVSTLSIPVQGSEKEDAGESLNIIIKSKNKKNKDSRRSISVLQGQSVDIQSKKPMSIKVDGESFGKTPVIIEKTNYTLRLLRPPRTDSKKSRSN